MEDEYTLIYYVAAWLATMVLLLFAHHLRRRPTKLNLPPGPRPLPIIGNLNLMGSLPDHISMHHLSKKYGQIMHLKFGSKNIVIGSSVEMAKVLLKTMDANFADRPKSVYGKYTTYDYSGITLSPYGPNLTQARKLCTMELFSAKRLEYYQYIRVEEIKLLLKTLHKSSGQEIVLKDLLATLSLNVISRMVLGKKYFDKSEAGGEEFRKTLYELLFMGGVFNIGDWIPWMGFMDHIVGSVRRLKDVSNKFDLFLERVLNDHDARRKTEGKNFVPLDMIDVLLQNVDDPSLDVKLERRGVKAITQDLLSGGIEGSAITVAMAMSELLKKPEILKKARDELDRVIGSNRWVEEKDMPNLPYITAIAKETMRLHPTSPLLIPRRAREDCKVAGYDIPKDTQVMVNVWAIGRDPQIWDKPEDFCPDRFIGKEIDVKGGNFELLPIGSGRRICLGCNLGLKLIDSSLANLLHGFDWKLPETSDPFVVIAHPRLLPGMYFV